MDYETPKRQFRPEGLETFGLEQPGAHEIRQMALGRIVPFQQLDIPLASPLSANVVYPAAGNFLTFSFDDMGALQASWPFPTWVFRCILMGPDGQPGARLPIFHGTTIRAPFFGLAFENNTSVGGGAVLRCLYGTNVDLQQHPRQIQVGPSNLALRTLNVGTSHTNLNNFRSTALLAGNVENIVSTAQNTAGLFVQFATLSGSGAPHSFVFGTAAPTAATDNSPLLLTDEGFMRFATTPHPRSIAAGNRLDRVSSANPQTGYTVAHVSYTLTQPWGFP
jgi:hypothetical protein